MEKFEGNSISMGFEDEKIREKPWLEAYYRAMPKFGGC